MLQMPFWWFYPPRITDEAIRDASVSADGNAFPHWCMLTVPTGRTFQFCVQYVTSYMDVSANFDRYCDTCFEGRKTHEIHSD